MIRRVTGWLLLVLAVASGSVGVWRCAVVHFGTLDEHWMLRGVAGGKQRPSVLDRVIREQEELQPGGPRRKRVEEWEALVSRSYQYEESIGRFCLLGALGLGWLGWRLARVPGRKVVRPCPPDCTAAGPFPLWVRFAVRHGTRRQVALTALEAYPTCIVLGLVSVILTGGNTWGTRALLVLWCCACLSWPWLWLAVRWLDRRGNWVSRGSRGTEAVDPNQSLQRTAEA